MVTLILLAVAVFCAFQALVFAAGFGAGLARGEENDRHLAFAMVYLLIVLTLAVVGGYNLQ